MMRNIKTRVKSALSNSFGRDIKSINPGMIFSANVISFDVFDTLILRTELSVPSDLFDSIYQNDSDFKIKRIKAETQARGIGRAKGLEDITIYDIYDVLNRNEGKACFDPLREIEAEYRYCKGNPKMIGFFNGLNRQIKRDDTIYSNHKLIITSDMYLPSTVITTILDNAGYDLDGVRLFVSGEIGLTKHRGSLFRHITTELKMTENGKKAFHIGDNIRSDYFMAKKAGWNAFLYKMKK